MATDKKGAKAVVDKKAEAQAVKAEKKVIKQRKREALELVRLRNSFYRDNYRRLGVIVVLMLGLVLFMAVMMYYMLSHRPPPVYFATNIQGGLIQLEPLNRPSVSTPELLNWVQRGASAAFTMNYLEYRQQIQDSMNTYFTPEGGDAFQRALAASRDLETIRANKFLVVARAVTAPSILDSGIYPKRPYAGRYYWHLKMRIEITARNEKRSVSPMLDLDILVVRSNVMVDTKAKSLDGFRGIGIGQLLASPVQKVSIKPRGI